MKNKIAMIRVQKGIKQTELAKKLKVDRSYLSKIENGHEWPSTRLLSRIAAELGVEVKDFF